MSQELLPRAACPHHPKAAPHSFCGSAGWQELLFCPCCLISMHPRCGMPHSALCQWGQGGYPPCSFALYFQFICSWLRPNLHRLSQPLCLCRVAVGGPLIPEGRHPPAFRVATLPAGDSVMWQFTCRVGACARMTVQPYLDLPARAAVIPGECCWQSHWAKQSATLPGPVCASCCHSQKSLANSSKKLLLCSCDYWCKGSKAAN